MLRGLDRVRSLGHPVLLALSNKYFLGAITGRTPGARLAATLGAVGWAADTGAAMLRLHDVGAARDLLAVREVLAGRAEVPEIDREDDALKWLPGAR